MGMGTEEEKNYSDFISSPVSNYSFSIPGELLHISSGPVPAGRSFHLFRTKTLHGICHGCFKRAYSEYREGYQEYEDAAG